MAGDGSLKHKALSALRGREAAPRANGRGVAPEPRPPLARLIVREQFDATEARVIARVIGVPPERLRALGAQLRGALESAVLIEGRDLLVTSAPCERVAAWLRDAGAAEVVVVKREVVASHQDAGTPGGTERERIRRGLRVASSAPSPGLHALAGQVSAMPQQNIVFLNEGRSKERIKWSPPRSSER
jgi:hypothetical protein